MAEPLMKAPVPVTLPPAPSTDFMNADQWETLWAILDGVLPSYVPASAVTDKDTQIAIPDDEFNGLIDKVRSSLDGAPSREEITEFLAYRPSEQPAFREDCIRGLGVSPARAKLAGVLGTLG
jgi:hypothetical protein